ncbi:MAG: PSD1 and planctomycete cytochrome C domain-containing protein [Zavarzinella sp.]
MKYLCSLLVLLPFSVGSAQQPLPADHAQKMVQGTKLFNQHVRAILIKHCLACHGGEKTEGELEIIERAHLLEGGDRGPAIVPGEPDKSLLYLMMTHAKKPTMPYKLPKLPAADLQHVREWIALGAPYDKPLLDRASATAWTEKKIEANDRKHWSFQPLKPVELPDLKDAPWAKTEIDRFILQKLQQAKLAPNPQTDPRHLIRRAYFDLIGMPPTPAEVEEFTKNFSEQTYAELIDRLLDSPHYGERWGRHWLDLARFAESHGFEHDYDRPSAYHYRDFVIKALNQGMPYDQFVRWQLAGDELAPKDPLALMATGFLAAGVHSTQITKNEVEKHRYDEMDDMLSTTTTAMLGLTVGCARCHDHKYDPIPAADYYRMLSTFTATVRSEQELQLKPERYLAAKQKFDQELAPLKTALEQYEAKGLAENFARWEKQPQQQALFNGWIIPTMESTKAAGGGKFELQSDGSYLITGNNPTLETLSFRFQTSLKRITGLQIEALTHASLVKKGPGRAANGNFCLTDLQVTYQVGKAPAVPVKLKNPIATFNQKGLGIEGAIDADPVTSGWAVDPQFGHDHAAALEFDQAISSNEPVTIVVTMKFHNNVKHGMGRPRLGITDQTALPKLLAEAIPESAVLAFQTPADKRTPAQRQALLTYFKRLDPEWKRLNNIVVAKQKQEPVPEKVKVLISSEGLPAVRLHTQGEDVLKETHFLRRGDPNQKEGVAPAGFLQVLVHSEKQNRWQAAPPSGSKLTYRRTAFANWMTDVEQGAGSLLARVIVNRLWQHHLGRGIVSTPSDFGVRGAPPSHPELLDYLANQLIQNGWQLKKMHKAIMMSAVYRQTSEVDEARSKQDPQNELCWHFRPRRLEAEAIRDSLLKLSGTLDPTMFGPGTLQESMKRRSIYYTVKRSRLIPMLIVFDAPDGTVGVGERISTTIAPQALFLMNNPDVRTWAKAFADRIVKKASDPANMVSAVYLETLSRLPTAEEQARAVQFLERQTKAYTNQGNSAVLALADFCQVVWCLNETIYVD